jgi:hypothetical protein
MSKNASPKLKELVRRLLAHEQRSAIRAGVTKAKPFAVVERLRKPLVDLSGVAGFRSLLSRSLALAGEDVLWLKALHIKADGIIEGLDELSGEVSYEDVVEGESALATHFMTFLVNFIGPTMTLKVLQDVWPKMTDIDF